VPAGAEVFELSKSDAAAGLQADDDALVRLDGVGKVHANGTVALSSVCLSVRRGEFVTLVGPSGCGKTTLLRIVAGLSPVSSGVVSVAGLPPQRARRERGDMAFVFQDATLLPWRTVLRNVEMPLQLAGSSRAERRERALESLETVGLADVAQFYPRQLSGGMRMRVSIARALVTNPRVLLMDEPFGALDELTRSRLNVELLRIAALADWTVLFVTHNVFEAVFLSSRVLVMSPRPGTIIADLPIALPYPRFPAVRTSLQFNMIAGDVLAAMHESE
jgi:NitT/TauT family transport system ATP-binding protein